MEETSSVSLTGGIAKVQHLVQLKKTRNSLRKFQAARHCQAGLKKAPSLLLLISVAFVCEVGTENTRLQFSTGVAQ
jgi:hypothetical protein